jgi:hypothetical protein
MSCDLLSLRACRNLSRLGEQPAAVVARQVGEEGAERPAAPFAHRQREEHLEEREHRTLPSREGRAANPGNQIRPSSEGNASARRMRALAAGASHQTPATFARGVETHRISASAIARRRQQHMNLVSHACGAGRMRHVRPGSNPPVPTGLTTHGLRSHSVEGSPTPVAPGKLRQGRWLRAIIGGEPHHARTTACSSLRGNWRFVLTSASSSSASAVIRLVSST